MIARFENREEFVMSEIRSACATFLRLQSTFVSLGIKIGRWRMPSRGLFARGNRFLQRALVYGQVVESRLQSARLFQKMLMESPACSWKALSITPALILNVIRYRPPRRLRRGTGRGGSIRLTKLARRLLWSQNSAVRSLDL